MPKSSEIKELSEILATALAGRPDLNKRLSTMLGARQKAGKPGKGKKEQTLDEMKMAVRLMFRNDFLKNQLKKVS